MIDVEAVKIFVTQLQNGEASYSTFMQLATHEQDLVLGLPLISERARRKYYLGSRDELENLIVRSLQGSRHDNIISL